MLTRRQLLALVPAVGAAGCGYTLAGRGSFLPDYIRTIGIPAFGNTTPYATVEQIFTEKVRIEFQSRGQYTVIPADTGADGVVRGTISGISAAPVGYTDAQLGGALALHWNFPRPLVEAVSQHGATLANLPAQGSLAAFVVRARHLARAYGIADGVERPQPRDLPAEWTHPPLSIALNQAGGIEGVIERAEAFLDATLAPAAA